MIEPGTGMVALGVALGGKDILIKLLGPTADYLGSGLKDFTGRRADNIKNIFANATSKLGTDIEKEGGIPPKVLKGIIDDGSFAEDPLSVDYFGGVLASSRTDTSRDDRGAYFNSLIGRLSAYQLRVHYIFYHLFKSAFNGEDISVSSAVGRNQLVLLIPFDLYFDAMDFSDSEGKHANTYLTHSMNGLEKEALIDREWTFGPVDHIKTTFAEASIDGIVVKASALGVELFMWAYGKGQTGIREFFQQTQEFKLSDDVKIIGSPIKKTLK